MVTPSVTHDLAIRGGTVVGGDGTGPVDSTVYIDGDTISAVTSEHHPAAVDVDARGMIVMPGMHNVHDHLRDMTPGVTAGEGLKLDEILRFYWGLMEISTAAEYEVMAAFSSARLLRSGMTSVVDHVYPFHRPGLADATITGYERTGIRWFLARGLMTRGYDPICEPLESAFDDIRRLVESGIDSRRVLPAPVSFRQAVPDDYRRARALADELGLRLYTHVAETDAEVEATLAEHGRRPVELLHDLGFTGPDVVLVHCVLLTDTEIDLLGRSGTHVVHCPSNHMRLAKGFTRVPDLLAAGVNVCLGVDQMVDLFREARQEVLLQSIRASNPGAISPATALEMATVRAARALGLDDLGRLVPGQRADVVCVDTRSLRFQPVLDPTWSLVHRAEGSDVTHVVVDGSLVVQDGKLTTVDEEALMMEMLDVVTHHVSRAGLDQRPLAYATREVAPLA